MDNISTQMAEELEAGTRNTAAILIIQHHLAYSPYRNPIKITPDSIKRTIMSHSVHAVFLNQKVLTLEEYNKLFKFNSSILH